MAWGDIPGLCDDKPRERAVSVSSEESEPDILTICSHSRRVKFAVYSRFSGGVTVVVAKWQ
jgi:hypothetical protein